MFEVVICTVSTGRVEKKCFATREEAARFVSKRRDGWEKLNRSPRNYRVEVRELAQPAAEPSRWPEAA
jgi:hypothetical protein